MPPSLGPYRLSYHLATGGFGEVYRAVDTRDGRDVAIKCLRRDITTGTEQRERFRREAELARRVVSPNVVQVLDFGTDPGGVSYIVMEFVDGRGLNDLFVYGLRPLSVEEIALLARDIAAGLAAIHAAGKGGIVHGDLKPANVLVDTRSGTGKISDFGVARSLVTTSTLPGQAWVAATMAYAPPEVAGGLMPTRQADVWSAGVVVLEMLAGRAPFASAPRDQVLVDETISDCVPASAEFLIDILRTCLRVDRAKRFADGAALHNALQLAVRARGIDDGWRSRIAESQRQAAAARPTSVAVADPRLAMPLPGLRRTPTPAVTSGGPVAPPPPPRRKALRRRTFIGGAAAVALVGAALGVRRALDDTGSPPAATPGSTNAATTNSPAAATVSTPATPPATSTAATPAVTRTAAVRSGDVLYSADWSRDLAGWSSRPYSGWDRSSTGEAINSGEFRDHFPFGDGDFLAHGPSMAAPTIPGLPADHAVEATFQFLGPRKEFDRADEPTISFGLVARGRNVSGGHAYLFGISYVRGSAMIAGPTPVDHLALGAIAAAPGSVFRIRAEIHGTSLVCVVNDSLRLTAIDTKFPGSGGVGLWSSGCRVVVTDFRVIAL
ncbi:MAG: serine/threonine-protein kinase [Dehalococcoidia bacterium]